MANNKQHRAGVSRRRFFQQGSLAAMSVGALVAVQVSPAGVSAQSPGQVAVASEFAFGDGLRRIRAAKKIVFAMAGSSIPPQYYHDPTTNKPAGFDVQVAGLIAADLEVDPVYEEAVTAARIVGLQAGKYDVVLGGTANSPRRALSVVFTRGYIPYDQVVLVKASSRIRTIEELNNPKYTITCALGTTAEYRARELFPAANIKPLQINEAMLEVAAGRADADLIEEYLAGPFAKNHPTTKLLGAPGKPFVTATEFGCMVCRSTDVALRDWLDNWIYWYDSHGKLPALYTSIMGPALRGAGK